MWKNVRTKLIIDKNVQFALVLQLLLEWALFVVFLSGMLLAWEMLTAETYQTLGGHFWSMLSRHAPLFLCIALLQPVLIYDSIKLSHRFVGPVMRLRRAIRQAARGEKVDPLNFRKADFWQDMAGDFNLLLERLPTSQQDRMGQANLPSIPVSDQVSVSSR